MKNIYLGIAVSLVASMSSLSAMAQADSKRFYGGAEIGSASVQNHTGEVSRALVSAVGGSVVVTQDSRVTVGRLFGGYTVTENVGLELGYSQSGDVSMRIAGVSSGSVAYTGTATGSYSGLDYSVILRPNVSTGVNGLFLRLGGHSLTGKANATLSAGLNTASASSSVSGSGTLIGIGYDLNAGPGQVRFGYTKMNKLGGQSDASTGLLSVGYLMKF